METQNHIQFILDNEVKTIDFEKHGLSSTTTVLNYLRSLPDHKGVKEGCAEGDCGACTVVVAEENNKGRLIYKALNSCLIFLPQIHGKQLITVENLAAIKEGEKKLHPVQEAIVKLNGSQCGYCTPGIVMSIFALYKNNDVYDQSEAVDGLTGNLCRCTGYVPILRATRKAIENKVPDLFSENEKKTLEDLQCIKSNSKFLEIITSNQIYGQPKTVVELFHVLEKYPDACIVNGSTDIALKQTKKFELLESIIDISAVSELKNITHTNGGILIGSGVPLEEIRRTIAREIPALSQMLNVFASRQIRELATLGGNIGTASPIGDSLPLLFALNAKLILANLSQERTLSIEDFIKAYRQTDLKKDEIIKSIFIPENDGSLIRFYKVSKRKDLDISTVSAGFKLKLIKDEVIDICLAFGGMAATPVRAKKTEKYLKGKNWNPETIHKALEILSNEFSPISDARSGKEFRKLAVKNLLLKFYNETVDE